MNTSTNYYIGIDAHKRFSQVHVLAEDGSTAWKGRIDVLVLAPGATETAGKYLHPVDYSKLPIHWMSAEDVVDTALKCIGKKVFVIPGTRNHLTACLSGGLWSRGLVQGVMKRLARVALPINARITAAPRDENVSPPNSNKAQSDR